MIKISRLSIILNILCFSFLSMGQNSITDTYQSKKQNKIVNEISQDDSLIIYIWIDTANPISSVLEYKIKSDSTETLSLYCYTEKVKKKLFRKYDYENRKLIKEKKSITLNPYLRRLIQTKQKKCKEIKELHCMGFDGTKYIFEYIDRKSVQINSYWSLKEFNFSSNEALKVLGHLESLEDEIQLQNHINIFANKLKKGIYLNDEYSVLVRDRKNIK